MKPNFFTVLLLLLLLQMLSCVDVDAPEFQLEEQEEYQLLFSGDPKQDKWRKAAVIRYFKLVVLGSEFGDDFPIVKKWKEPMRVYLTGAVPSELYNETGKIISEINTLTVGNFEVQVVEKREDSNFVMFFGKAGDYAHKFPGTSSFIKNNRGLFTIYHNENFEIYKGHMFVDIEKTLPTERKHILREELTQSLGLTNDIPYYFDSIFYDDWSTTTSYSELDMEVIRLLYHPKVIAGLSEQSLQNVLSTIMGLN